jgi:GH24 family phage-related lysozyme (muramidase)
MDSFTLISGHEGLRLSVYKDTDGSDTIGYGFHLDTLEVNQKVMLAANHGGNWQNIYHTGITSIEAASLLNDRIKDITGWLDETFPWFIKLSQIRQAVLTDMVYEMGEGSSSQGTGIFGFKHLLAAMAIGDWDEAVRQMENSHWASQVPDREQEDALLILQG